MGFGMMLLAATLACPPVDTIEPLVQPMEIVTHDGRTISVDESLLEEAGDGPLPKLLDAAFHKQMHEHKSAKDGARRMSIWCEFYPVNMYKEHVYFSSAAHSTVVGWRIAMCDGSFHGSGSVTAFCDRYLACCTDPYDDQVDTCEGT